MPIFDSPCEPNTYDLSYQPVMAFSSGPAIARLVNPRVVRGLRLKWSGPYPAVAGYIRGLWNETAGGVMPLTLDGSRPVVGNFLMDKKPNITQTEGVWSITMTLIEDLY